CKEKGLHGPFPTRSGRRPPTARAGRGLGGAGAPFHCRRGVGCRVLRPPQWGINVASGRGKPWPTTSEDAPTTLGMAGLPLVVQPGASDPLVQLDVLAVAAADNPINDVKRTKGAEIHIQGLQFDRPAVGDRILGAEARDPTDTVYALNAGGVDWAQLVEKLVVDVGPSDACSEVPQPMREGMT